MRRLENFMGELAEEERELVPIRSIPEKNIFGNFEGRKSKGFTMPKLVEFEVPVLLQFNGHLSRARLVGILLKQAYQSNLDNFPLPLNGDSREITDEIR
uniref:Uncharacterized protein n=1 Tax=Meloidogyne javanica TaxID=6303 RepID=A0A915LK82_MELJA